MAIFSYKALSQEGKLYKAQMESLSLHEAKQMLIEKGIALLEIKESKGVKDPKISLTLLLHFTRELLQLIEAGLPLFESLALLKEQFSQGPFSIVLHGLSQQLSSGTSFSFALTCYPKCFGPLYCSLVRAGEHSGNLEKALQKIIEESQRENKLKKQIQSALIYPSILMVFCLALIHLMMYYIVPSLEDLFDLENCTAFTQTTIHLTQHLKKWEWAYLVSSFSIFICLKIKIRDPKLKPYLDHLLLKLPLLKSFLIDLNLSQISSTLSMLLKGGIPLLEALKLSKSIIRNQILHSAIEKIMLKIEEGEKLSEELKKNPLFPSIFSQIIEVGEKTGELDKSFEKLAAMYQESVETKLSKLMTLLSPIILLIMGIFIGTVMLGILIPLTDINSLSI
jgi:general secretion pathway protein F